MKKNQTKFVMIFVKLTKASTFDIFFDEFMRMQKKIIVYDFEFLPYVAKLSLVLLR